MSAIATTFIASLAGFALIGVASSLRRKSDTADYLIAGRSMPPWLVGLSAVATNNSGYMFIGLIGFTYEYGLSSIWLSVGWLFGDWLAWYVVHEPLRRISADRDARSFSGFVGGWGDGGQSRLLIAAAGLITLIFLGIYAAAQLKAGSKALEVMFGWDPATGAILGAVIVALYCFSGGIRASIWTDAAQSFVMIFAMGILAYVAMNTYGGPSELLAKLQALNPSLVQWTPPDAQAGLALYMGSWIAAGLGVVGQPHIMVRTMTLDDPSKMRRVRNIYFAWYVPFTILAIAAGLYSRLALETGGFDAELALPRMALELLPGFMVGIVLAALFAATMSTADSQILACSAAITQDIAPSLRKSVGGAKIATLAVCTFALGVALFGSGNVFDLVVLAWSTLASTLGPIVALRTLRQPVNAPTGIAMMATGLIVVITWRQLGWNSSVYEALPAMLATAVVYGLARATGIQPAAEAQKSTD